MSTSTYYEPKLPSGPSHSSMVMALRLRSGDIPDSGQHDSIRYMANMSLAELARESYYWRHGNLSDMTTASELIRTEFSLSGGAMANVFDGWFGSVVRQAYAESEDKTAGLLWETEVENYMVTRIIRVIDNVLLLPRGHGRANMQSLMAYVVEWKANEYAKVLAVSEMDLVDDVFHSIQQCAKCLGRGPKRLKEDAFFSLLLQNPTLPDDEQVFSEQHGNFMSGGSSALSNTSLATAISKIRSQTILTEDGVIHCEIAPRYLVVPPLLEDCARQALRLQKLDNEKLDLQLIVTSRLSSIGVCDPLTGQLYTGTNSNWALFADANDAPVFAVGFLKGNKEPKIRMFETGGPGAPGMFGLEWDIHQSIAVGAVDYKGSVWSTGA